ncbi:TonB-dependent receptor domain-containing protein [Paraglaciecola sp. L3A3]|uniref:TonB-dependent receptor family protein n=1 Tax=Paraglaciecola sp. L3A3 TaxID=2686358 RepID=UPI00131A61CD|nr:TonB-dependent receptor [Paraglaciecola sp. L3A3]
MLPFKRSRLAICFTLPFITFANAQTTQEPVETVETIVVQGEQTKLDIETERLLTPGGVTIVDSAELYARNIANLADMLRYVPGVWATSTNGSDGMFFSSRGSNLDATNYDMNGIKLLQDGLPVTAADGNNHNRMIDPLSASFATIARGANALTYGASTLGGAIDFVTPTARDLENVELFVNGGSHGQLQGRLSAGVVAGDFDGLLTLESKQWHGYRQHNKQDRQGVYANAGLQLSDNVQTRLYLTYINNDQELPGALSAEQFAEDPYQADPKAITGHFQVNVETARLASKTSWKIDDKSSLTFGLSYEDQTLYHPIVDKVLVDFDGPGPEAPTEVFSLLINTDQTSLGSSLRYNLQAGDHNLLLGMNYAQTAVKGGNYRNDGGQRNGLTTLVDNDADSLELFVFDRWQVADKWQLMYGLQSVSAGRDVRSTEVADDSLRNPSADYDSINPRAGVIYQQSADSQLFANISRLYEAPTNFELEDDVRADNSTLDAMSGTVLEVGTRGQQQLQGDNLWRWDLAFYYAKLSDEILSMDDPTAPGTSLSTNVDSTIHAGIEALVGASFTLGEGAVHTLEPLVSVTVNEFSFDGDVTYGNNDLPAAPAYVVKGEIIYCNSNGFYLGPTFDLVDERYADFSNSYTIDSYALLGLRTGLSGEGWEAYAEIRNLTDKKYVSSHSVRDIAAADAAILNAGEPRSVYLGLKISL